MGSAFSNEADASLLADLLDEFGVAGTYHHAAGTSSDLTVALIPQADEIVQTDRGDERRRSAHAIVSTDADDATYGGTGAIDDHGDYILIDEVKWSVESVLFEQGNRARLRVIRHETRERARRDYRRG